MSLPHQAPGLASEWRRQGPDQPEGAPRRRASELTKIMSACSAPERPRYLEKSARFCLELNVVSVGRRRPKRLR